MSVAVMRSESFNRTRRNRWASWGLFVVLLMTASSLDYSLTPEGVADGYLTVNTSDTPSGQSLAMASAEFRAVAANLLWIKVVDHYHHEYLAKGGVWSQNTALMPYLRMITWLDPHFIQAYDVGSGILSQTHRYKDCAAYLELGIRNNENDWTLKYDVALLRAWDLKSPETALPYALMARKDATDPFDQRRLDKFITTLQDQAAAQKAGKPLAYGVGM